MAREYKPSKPSSYKFLSVASDTPYLSVCRLLLRVTCRSQRPGSEGKLVIWKKRQVSSGKQSIIGRAIPMGNFMHLLMLTLPLVQHGGKVLDIILCRKSGDKYLNSDISIDTICFY